MLAEPSFILPSNSMEIRISQKSAGQKTITINNNNNKTYRQPIVSSLSKTICTVEIVSNVNSCMRSIYKRNNKPNEFERVKKICTFRRSQGQRIFNGINRIQHARILLSVHHSVYCWRQHSFTFEWPIVLQPNYVYVCICSPAFAPVARFFFGFLSAPDSSLLFRHPKYTIFFYSRLDIGLYGRGELAQFWIICGFDFRSLEFGTYN